MTTETKFGATVETMCGQDVRVFFTVEQLARIDYESFLSAETEEGNAVVLYKNGISKIVFDVSKGDLNTAIQLYHEEARNRSLAEQRAYLDSQAKAAIDVPGDYLNSPIGLAGAIGRGAARF